MRQKKENKKKKTFSRTFVTAQFIWYLHCFPGQVSSSGLSDLHHYIMNKAVPFSFLLSIPAFGIFTAGRLVEILNCTKCLQLDCVVAVADVGLFGGESCKRSKGRGFKNIGMVGSGER